METVKEKLVMILDDYWEVTMTVEDVADVLISNGVTIDTDTNDGDKWVSVDERLPITEKEAMEYYEINSEFPQFIVKIDVGVTAAVLEFNGKDWFDGYATYNVTHWMPLPSVEGLK